MKEEHFLCQGMDNIQIDVCVWRPEGQVKAVLQITHGMTEHIARYAVLAENLTKQGIAVAGVDLRGHGHNPGDPKCASFGENGWDASISDMHICFEALEQRFSTVPHFMLGFSLGSFLLREYLARYTDPVAGAAILGTGQQPAAILTIIKAIVKTQIRKAGFDQTTPLVTKLSFETYNQRFAPVRTAFDWLCADEKELDIYIADPLCRETISSGLFWQLLDAMERTGDSTAYNKWNKMIPVLLLSGQKDPVGDFGKGVQRIYDQMKKAGMQNVRMQLFADARHDLLHEENSGCAEKARSMLIEWMDSVIEEKNS